MKLLGITGGIGMGKSTAGRLLIERDVPVIDTDEIARELVQAGQPTLKFITRVFGTHHLAPDGSLDRKSLAAEVFPNLAARRRLESILHPPIRQCWMARVDELRAQEQRCAAVVIPLLFETHEQGAFDLTFCVACSASTQRLRLEERGWSEEECAQRIAAQMAVEEKLALADRVIWTEGQLAIHAAQWDRVLAEIG